MKPTETIALWLSLYSIAYASLDQDYGQVDSLSARHALPLGSVPISQLYASGSGPLDIHAIASGQTREVSRGSPSLKRRAGHQEFRIWARASSPKPAAAAPAKPADTKQQKKEEKAKAKEVKKEEKAQAKEVKKEEKAATKEKKTEAKAEKKKEKDEKQVKNNLEREQKKQDKATTKAENNLNKIAKNDVKAKDKQAKKEQKTENKDAKNMAKDQAKLASQKQGTKGYDKAQAALKKEEGKVTKHTTDAQKATDKIKANKDKALNKNEKGLNKAMDKAHSSEFKKDGTAKDHPNALQKFKTAMSWIGTAVLDVVPGMEAVGAGLTAGRLAAQGIAKGVQAGVKAGAKKVATTVGKKLGKEGEKQAEKNAQPEPPNPNKAETKQQAQAAQDHRNKDVSQYQQLAQQVRNSRRDLSEAGIERRSLSVQKRHAVRYAIMRRVIEDHELDELLI